eukprot:1469146-Pleurochrysis_carterae.AAC.7
MQKPVPSAGGGLNLVYTSIEISALITTILALMTNFWQIPDRLSRIAHDAGVSSTGLRMRASRASFLEEPQKRIPNSSMYSRVTKRNGCLYEIERSLNVS